MEDKLLKEDIGCRRENDERKQPYTHRDIKRKLSFIKKKVDDLQHQRKIAYKNSVKVKRMVHNQINQIVKCLRSRERYLWAEIDDAYLSQDENISQELLRLQTVHSSCQALFEHLEDNPRNAKALSKIYSSLAQVNYEDKLNGKALEFTSEFETLKSMAADFGKLVGDSSKKDEFIIIDNDSSSNITYEKIHNNRDYFKMAVSENNFVKEDSSKDYLSIKSDPEDLFEVITVSDMSCGESEKDFHMADQDNFENGCIQIENLSLSSKSGNKLKDSNKFENSQNASKDKDFNPEEEWKQLFELKNKVSSICGLIPGKLENGSCNSGNENATSYNLNTLKISNEFLYLSPNEVNDWLPEKSAREDNKATNKCMWQSKYLFESRGEFLKRNSELDKNKMAESYDRSQINSRCQPTPAEIVRREFSKYSVKDEIENWLSR